MRKQAGYTIIEVLVAVIILAIVLPGLAGMVIASRKTQVGNERFENAAAYGQALLDSLQLIPSARVQDNGSKTTTIDNQSYTASWIATVPANGTTGKRIAITIAWTVGNKAHSSTLTGVIP